MMPRLSRSAFAALALVALSAPAALGQDPAAKEPAIRELILLLGDPDRGREAAAALAKVGAPAVKPLIEALGNVGGSSRRWAAVALSDMGDAARPAIPSLVAALRDPVWQVRGAAAMTLGGLKAAEAAPGLRVLLRHTRPEARRIAARALGEIGAPAKAAAPDLIGALEDRDSEVRACAAEALGAITEAEEAIAPLATALADVESSVAYKAAEALSAFGARAAPELISVLGSKDPEVRKRAAYGLCCLGAEARAATPDLIKALGDSNPQVRKFAAWTLGLIGADARSARPALWSATADNHEAVRACALSALVKIDPSSDRVAEAVLKNLNAPDPDTRAFGAELLGGLRVFTPAVIAGLRRALADSEEGVRVMAILACGQMGRGARAASPDLIKALNAARGWELRASIIQALGEVGGPEAARALEAARKDPEAKVRKAAEKALEKLRGSR